VGKKLTSIEGLEIFTLKRIEDERGAVMHMLRSDDKCFESFGEVYFSLVKAGVVKAWKRHKKMTQFFAVPFGEIKLVVYDSRSKSFTYQKVQEILIGGKSYNLVRVPKMVWYGFKAINDKDALLANCATLPHDPDESEVLHNNSDKIPYNWF